MSTLSQFFGGGSFGKPGALRIFSSSENWLLPILFSSFFSSFFSSENWLPPILFFSFSFCFFVSYKLESYAEIVIMTFTVIFTTAFVLAEVANAFDNKQ